MILALLLGCAGREGLAGVVIVDIDTLRADRLGAYGSTAGLTPNLDRFAAESVVFERAYAQSNETLYSHASLFSARYPSELGRLDMAFRMPPEAPTLASVLRDAGWTTGGFTSGGHLSPVFGLGSGFSTWRTVEAWGSLRDSGAEGLRWLDGAEAPFLLFVHGYDPHDRYLKPPPFGYSRADAEDEGLGARLARRPGATSRIVGGRFTESIDALGALARAHARLRPEELPTYDPAAEALTAADVGHIAGVYDGSVAWADAAFGVFLAGLDARGLLDRVAIVVLSDHGEELGEDGAFHHRFGLGDAEVHVPLMVRVPGVAARRVPGVVELLDVAPTVWALAGVSPPVGARGASLLPAVRGEAEPDGVAFSEGALRLLSVRGRAGRLTAEGLSPDNPAAPRLLQESALDGVNLAWTPEAGVGEGPAAVEGLRAALVERVSGLGQPAGVRR